MSIIKAKTLSVSSITGLGSGQTEEIDLLFTYKRYNLDDSVLTPDDPIIKRFVVHRSQFNHILEKVGTKNRISFYAGPVLLETINTDDYDWFNETYYSVSEIDNIANVIYSALSF